MRIAILGSRGIPGSYGGFETCAEELSTRLARRGHDVTVYCSRPYSPSDAPTWRGVRRVILPTVRIRALDKLVFTLLSLVHATLERPDVVLVLGIAAAPFVFLPRLRGTRVILNVDGLEWRRRKWGRLASAYLRFAERAACRTAGRLVTDARCVQDHYREVYGRETTFIPYGTRVPAGPANGALSRLGLVPGEYVLYVSRFEKENNPLLVRRAFETVKTDKRLLMLGSAPYAAEYVRQVRDTRDDRVLFPGAIYGDAYLELQANAYVYVQATEVGGTHPALVEALGTGGGVIANDVPEHREVLGEDGLYYDGTETGLARVLQEVIDRPERLREQRAASRERAQRYSWETITRDYETMFEEMRAC